MSDNFFNKPNSSLVEIHDSQGAKKKIAINKLRLRVSVYGLLIKENKALVSWNPIINQYVLPGGAIELGESIENALVREFKEETGLKVKIGKLITVKEDFFMLKQLYAHSILLFYQVNQIDGKLLTTGNNDDSERVEYMELKNIHKQNITPIFKSVLKK